MQHIPVLMEEVLRELNLCPGSRVIDGTVGLGGHSAAILEATAPDGSLIAFDRDARNLETAKANLARFGERAVFIHDSFGSLGERVEGEVDGVLLDLGFSSVHVDDPARGFSFQSDGPLDMRYDTRGDLTAEDIVNSWSREEIARILRVYGDETWAAQIAKAIFDARRTQRITTTLQLAEVVASVVRRKGKVHPATKTFQALRIVVNNELGEIEKGLQGIEQKLRKGGRAVIITFHSLEDRLIKQFFKNSVLLSPVYKKPIKPTREEVQMNSRARSAKLRVAEKI